MLWSWRVKIHKNVWTKMLSLVLESSLKFQRKIFRSPSEWIVDSDPEWKKTQNKITKSRKRMCFYVQHRSESVSSKYSFSFSHFAKCSGNRMGVCLKNGSSDIEGINVATCHRIDDAHFVHSSRRVLRVNRFECKKWVAIMSRKNLNGG